MSMGKLNKKQKYIMQLVLKRIIEKNYENVVLDYLKY